MTLEELQTAIRTEVGVLLYFSGENCNVCHALRPKFKEVFDKEFPQLKQIYLDAHENAEISAHFQVFSVPYDDCLYGWKRVCQRRAFCEFASDD